ncbi:MAG: FKBP-type peptidyl-prolyl cis-trans isomerase N-terminal domain-containing protein [Rikenellaceae bacterium]
MKKTILAATLAVAALAATSCGGEQSTGYISMGKTSKIDSLSYALGTNIAFGVSQQMGDIPMDFETITEAFESAVFEKNELTHEEAIEVLRDYFMNKRRDRAAQVEAARQEADSIAIAGGADPAEVAAARTALKADAAMFESEAERKEVSYAFGIDLGTNIREVDFPVQVYWIKKGLTDADNGSSIFGADEAREFLTNYFEVVRPAELAKIQAEELAKIAKQKGVVTTESGLMYRIEKEGDDLFAKDDRDVVKVFYTGKTISSGEVFDTNRFADRDEAQQEAMLVQNPDAATADQPIEFPLNRVIPGWTEGMKLVGRGGRISLWIPSELAYGERGSGRAIGANEALFFDVELVDVAPYVEVENIEEAE